MRFTAPSSAACNIIRWLRPYMLSPVRTAAVVAVLLMALFTVGSRPVAAADGGPPTIRLYGDAGRGWGLNATVITTPGPNLTVLLGYPVILVLSGEAGVTHDWFIDYNDNKQPDVGEPKVPDFIGPSPQSSPPITPDRNGTWTYRCAYHPNTMFGTIHVMPQTNVTLYGNAGLGWGFSNTTIQKPGPSIAFLAGTNVTFALIPGIMLIALSGVLIFAAVYHVRAVRAAKRSK